MSRLELYLTDRQLSNTAGMKPKNECAFSVRLKVSMWYAGDFSERFLMKNGCELRSLLNKLSSSHSIP